MKPERRISNSVLLACMAALTLALVASWFSWRTQSNPAGEVATGSEAQPVTVESDSAVAEAATAPAGQVNLRGEAENRVRRENTQTDDAPKPQAHVQRGQTTRVTPGGAVLQGHVRFATSPAKGEDLTIKGQLDSFVPEMPSFRNAEEYSAFMFSPKTQAEIRAAKNFEVEAGEEGSIYLDCVPPGTYTLTLSALKPTERPRYFIRTAGGSVKVTVPEGADARTPVQLDEIILGPAVPGRPVFR